MLWPCALIAHGLGFGSDRQALGVKPMNMRLVRRQIDRVAGPGREIARTARRHRADPIDIDVQEGVGAEMLGNQHFPLPVTRTCRQQHMLRPDADGVAAEALGISALDEIHLRRADETGDEEIARAAIEFQRRTHLLDIAAVEHDDLVGHGHGLDLIVRHIDHRRLQLLMQLADFESHVDAQRRVQVRQGLVEQEGCRLAHDGAADGDALTLTAGKLARLALQIVREVQDARGIRDLLVDFRLRHIRHFERKSDVLAHAHMRIERVGLEHHGKAAVGRLQIGAVLSVDHDLPAGDVFEAGDQAQKRGLAAAGRADEHHELTIIDLEVDGRDDLGFAEDLGNLSENNATHACLPYLTAPKVRPRTSCFWLNQPRIRIGAIAMVDAAESLA
ncbi:hypothetical protein RHSP_44117 [Rhizobium freirei PRF 81]|uniref:Uncharacterized protein n=1 Tax=Rhizobium freirei PRF 81 TaxID=363754 RepID=N6V947_9HYPH|nr:hypothetical protein RHSP_44117 [Rhizobium freirei PRF 81]